MATKAPVLKPMKKRAKPVEVAEDATPQDAFRAGVEQANAENKDYTEEDKAECAAVKAHWEKLDRTRKYDKDALEKVARDRMYANCESSFEVKCPVIASYIDTWNSILFARNPDVDVIPSKSVSSIYSEDVKEYSETLEAVVSYLFKKAKLKAQSKPWTRAALTSIVGWQKITWQERTGIDPLTKQQVNDTVDNIKKIEFLQTQLAKGEINEQYNVRLDELKQLLASLEAKTETVQSFGLAIDPVDMEDLTVSDECVAIVRYLEAPWIDHRSYMRAEDAQIKFNLTDDQLKECNRYAQKPLVVKGKTSGGIAQIAPDATDKYTGLQSTDGKPGDFVEVHEKWDRDTNSVYTMIRGLKKYARAPFTPIGTARFYPFFLLALTEVDGKRWPDSLNSRSHSLQDEFERTLNAYVDHRKRVRPKIIFHGGLVSAPEMKKVVSAGATEYIPVKITGGAKVPIKDVFAEVKYPNIDMALYVTEPIMQKFELIWGLQEAMQGTINTPKTAREAEIQQTGSQARTSDKRDILDDALTEIAQYTAELAVQQLDSEQVRVIAGKAAIWIQLEDIEDLESLVSVEIRAGSSGKPNTVARQQAWSVIMPQLVTSIEKIAALRQSNPLEVAECLEEVVKETLSRTGDRLDIERFMPQVGQPVQLLDPASGQMVLAYPAPAPVAPGGGPAPMGDEMPVPQDSGGIPGDPALKELTTV